jgi:hypothetical protein
MVNDVIKENETYQTYISRRYARISEIKNNPKGCCKSLTKTQQTAIKDIMQHPTPPYPHRFYSSVTNSYNDDHLQKLRDNIRNIERDIYNLQN